MVLSAAVFLSVTDFGTDGVSFGLVALPLGAAYVVYLTVYFPRYYRYRWLKAMERLDRHHPIDNMFGRLAISIVDDQLVNQSPVGESRIALSSIQHPAVTDTHCFLGLSNQTYVIVPRSKVIEGDFDSFVNLLKARIPEAPAS